MAVRTLVGQRTYWHLLDAKRVPSRYELVTSRLLYHPTMGLSVRTPVAAWLDKHQAGSRLALPDWDVFADPRATTYASYTEERDHREIHLDVVMARASELDRRLEDEAISFAERTFGPLRFVRHALMMTAAYLGSVAPGGRLAVASAFQAGDEIRHVDRLAQRVAWLRRVRAGFADNARATWVEGPAWQPLRRLVERLLVAYDWGECFTALTLVVKPTVDHFAMTTLAERARELGDGVTHDMYRSLEEDADWHRQWACACATVALSNPGNREAIDSWVKAWEPAADEAVGALAVDLGVDAECARKTRASLLGKCGLAS